MSKTKVPLATHKYKQHKDSLGKASVLTSVKCPSAHAHAPGMPSAPSLREPAGNFAGMMQGGQLEDT